MKKRKSYLNDINELAERVDDSKEIIEIRQETLNGINRLLSIDDLYSAVILFVNSVLEFFSMWTQWGGLSDPEMEIDWRYIMESACILLDKLNDRNL